MFTLFYPYYSWNLPSFHYNLNSPGYAQTVTSVLTVPPPFQLQYQLSCPRPIYSSDGLQFSTLLVLQCTCQHHVSSLRSYSCQRVLGWVNVVLLPQVPAFWWCEGGSCFPRPPLSQPLYPAANLHDEMMSRIKINRRTNNVRCIQSLGLSPVTTNKRSCRHVPFPFCTSNS